MKIEDLDEAQGLTAEMVRKYLERTGWTMAPAERQPDGYLPPGKFWTKGSLCVWDASVLTHFEVFACAEGKSVQALLREINPRLRPWPSDSARFAHRGYWLAVCKQDGTACMGRFRLDVPWFKHSGNHILSEEDSFAGYWPCDEFGQRIRWPEKDGVML